MRYIGNKTKLLRFIGSVLDRIGARGSTAADPFAGTASVAQFLKKRGYATISSDLMTYSYVFQRAYVELDRLPDFSTVRSADRDLAALANRDDFRALVGNRFGSQQDLFGKANDDATGLHHLLVYLDTYLHAYSSLITREYSTPQDADVGGDGRMYFTAANGQRIDAIRTKLHEWREEGLLSPDEYYLLLACLLEAADSVANTTGVYAAFVKSWQGNAKRPLRMQEPELALGTRLPCKAYQMDANEFVQGMDCVDVLYLDPPYNTRQYSAYYHVPELIAKGWFEAVPELRGKTGLIPDADKKSRWSVAGECEAVFADLIRNANARYIVLSYNNEGIISPETVDQLFREVGREGTIAKHAVEYTRYRSDRDHEQRSYKTDVVTEFIYTVETGRC
jgi:adenine-specific DNA-methyltransferase